MDGGSENPEESKVMTGLDGSSLIPSLGGVGAGRGKGGPSPPPLFCVVQVRL